VRVVVTGGGSGGHIYPALALADAIEREHPGAEIAYVGGTAGMEARIVPAAGRQFRGVATRKLTRLASPSAVAALFALLKGYRQAKVFVKEWKPDAIVGTGGYVAAAAILAGSRLGIPTTIISPDAVAGRTNRWLSRWATRICLWLGSDDEFPTGRIYRTGLPIRPEVVSTESQQTARQTLGLADRFTALVIGGSQGAQRVNELVTEAAGSLPSEVQILHQTGERNFEDVKPASDRHVLRPYLAGDDLPMAYRAADVLICRCGVGMLAEGTANGLPLLMIPLPTAYADHQSLNARVIEKGGGGVLLPQSELTGERLAREIIALKDDAARRALLAKASRKIGKPEAAAEVAKLTLEMT
jgi:UDP-N-acetylglucosamine--N-acetylmuramyl-(pentapeptide) pyrophosphoryl-undecaprenol N-acetylglucosamine transferase